MHAGNPYHRVLPTYKPMTSSSLSLKKRRDSSKPARKANNHIPEIGMRSSEPLEYISGEDVMAIYKLKKSWLYASAKKNQVPICKIAGKNYYSRKHLDALFGVTAEIEALTEWLTTEDARLNISIICGVRNLVPDTSDSKSGPTCFHPCRLLLYVFDFDQMTNDQMTARVTKKTKCQKKCQGTWYMTHL